MAKKMKNNSDALMRITPDYGKSVMQTTRLSSDRNTNHVEDSVIEALDQKNFLVRYSKWIENIRTGKLDVNQALQDMAPDALINLVYMAMSKDSSQKTKLAAVQDLLDRSGYGKVQKHALATVDASQSKEALLSLLLGAGKDLKDSGIEIIDDEANKAK